MQNKAPIIYGDGKQTRCFSYIDDCLSCLIPMLEDKNLNKQIINIGPDEEFVTINKIAAVLINCTINNFFASETEYSLLLCGCSNLTNAFITCFNTTLIAITSSTPPIVNPWISAKSIVYFMLNVFATKILACLSLIFNDLAVQLLKIRN